jgi:zinc protease
MTVPALAKQRVSKLPVVGDTVLDNGLRVLTVRRPGIPMVQVRLRVPFAAPTGKAGAAHVAKADLLASTLLSGTSERDAAGLAIALQSLGANLFVDADADRLGFGGSVLTSGLGGLLNLIAEVLTSASYPARDVEGERDRKVQELAIMRSQTEVIALEALMARLYGSHPYALMLPQPEDVAAVTPASLRSLHRSRLVPKGSILTLVGDITPKRADALVAKAFGGWTAEAVSKEVPRAPKMAGQTALLVNRPGAVQTTIKLGGPAPSRADAGFAAAAMANMVFGGYFSSRLVANIREDKGYTYSPASYLEHPSAGSRLQISADVATAVTGPSILEIMYELGRISSVPVTQDELDQARRYAIGILSLSTSTQAGLAGYLSQLAAQGIGVEFLRDYPAALEAVTVEDVLEAGARWFSPRNLTPVLVGDTALIENQVRSLIDVELV